MRRTTALRPSTSSRAQCTATTAVLWHRTVRFWRRSTCPVTRLPYTTTTAERCVLLLLDFDLLTACICGFPAPCFPSARLPLLRRCLITARSCINVCHSSRSHRICSQFYYHTRLIVRVDSDDPMLAHPVLASILVFASFSARLPYPVFSSGGAMCHIVSLVAHTHDHTRAQSPYFCLAAQARMRQFHFDAIQLCSPCLLELV